MKLQNSCFSAILLLVSAALAAQNTVYESLTIEDGLANGMVFDLCQTRDGFLWAGLEEALCRYDGYNFKQFRHNPRRPFSVAENAATALFEDSRGWLWVGLYSKGLDLYDPKTGFFHHFPLDSGKNAGDGRPAVRRIIETPDGAIWVLQAKTNGLHRITIPEAWKNGLPAQANLQPLASIEAPPLPVRTPREYYMHTSPQMLIQADGKIAIFCLQAKYIVDPRTLTTVEMPDEPIPNAITVAQGDPAYDGDFWAASEQVLWRLRHGETRRFDIPKVEQPERLVLQAGKNGHVWLGYHHKMWDLAPGEDFDPNRPDLLLNATPTAWVYDRSGSFWIGTMGYGLRKINALQKRFHAGAAGTPVNGVWANRGEYFTKGFFDIRRYDPNTGKIAADFAFPDAPRQQIDLAFEPSGAAWLLCARDAEGKPALRYYPSGSGGKAARVFSFEGFLDPANPLTRTPDGHIWVAAESNVLVRFDPVAERFYYFSFAHLFQGSFEKRRVLAFARDATGAVWIGTERGLVRGTPRGAGFDFQLIRADENNPAALSHNNVACLLPDPQYPGGRLWIATKGGGINYMDTRTGRCRHIRIADGLLDEVVYAILPGARANEFWCSTNRGLAKITVRPGREPWVKINTFTAKLGLQNNEFNTSSFFKADNGELLFGGVNGLNRFFPDDIRYENTTPPPVFVVGLEINYRKTDFGDPDGLLQSPIENLRELRLDHWQNNVSFEFAVLDFADPAKSTYRYRLVGLDDDWVEVGRHRFAHFSHLAPGKYELRVQGSNGESDWRDAAPLVLVVRPPWYRSTLAYCGYLLLLGWAVRGAYQFQIGRVKEREHLAFEQRETERIRAVEQLKTNFFSNITHEFRTPLTLIIEPLRQFLQKPGLSSEDLEKIRLAEKNSRQLLGLVNQLLDMAKLESGQMTLDLRRGNLGEAVRAAFERFLPLAEKRGIKIYMANPPADLPVFDFDVAKTALILNNLISNALKFTPEGGMVQLAIAPEGLTPQAQENRKPDAEGENPKSEHQEPTIEIRVSDTGIGIAPEHLDKIFDRFYQVDASHTRAEEGTGIGLALSKELAELMGGEIRVVSELGKGSTFSFVIPVRKPFAATAAQNDLIPNARAQPQTAEVSPAQAKEKSAPAEAVPVVLIIEDNADLRSFIKNSVGKNWQVVEASNGEEGIKKAFELVPDLVISDVMMPLKDGFAVVNELKNGELTAHIPIILLTAKSGIASRLKGLQQGADDYLTKPFSTAELLVRMENLVENRRRLRAIFSGQSMEQTAGSEAGAGGESNAFLTPPDRAFLQKFTLLIEENLSNESMSIEDFAQKLLLSRSQLHRKLNALTGQNSSEFIRNYRLDRAYAMLKNREGGVGEIALRTGFGNEKYFSTAFKEKFGTPPSQV